MDTPAALNPESATRRAWWKSAAGYLLAAVLLVWVFHDTQFGRMLAHIRGMNWWWVIPAVACDLLSYVCEGVRWHYLLRPVGRLPVVRATQAIYIGLFTNEVTPMRLGEVVRTYLAAQWMDVPFARTLPSMLVSRLIDGIWLAIAVGLVAFFVPLPRDLLLAGDLFGAMVLVLVAASLVLLKWAPALASRRATAGQSRRGVLGAVGGVAWRIGQGLVELGSLRTLLLPSLYSLGILAFQALSFWLVMKAYNMALPFFAGAAVYLIVHFGTALPNAPANVGAYQFFTVLGLGLFGVDKSAASGFSVVVFVILTLPLWAFGLVALSRSGLTLAGIRADLKRLSRPFQTPAP